MLDCGFGLLFSIISSSFVRLFRNFLFVKDLSNFARIRKPQSEKPQSTKTQEYADFLPNPLFWWILRKNPNSPKFSGLPAIISSVDI